MAEPTTSINRGGSQEVVKETKQPEGKSASLHNTTEVEEPYTLYKNSRPDLFLADYFGLGDTWNDAVGGFPREIEIITNYLQGKIKSGTLADSQKTIKESLQKMERLNNLHKEPRMAVKIPILASYVKFLAETDGAKHTTS